ncbi:MAG: pyridoxal-phosphate dependent enzyme [Deltaproteobacteria bacterium]|nr:pyridoxal-phosphate dependent enzyme [Deltaproteobacteria bacterium]
MIDLRVNEKQLERAIERARERNILIPKFQELIRPDLISQKVRNKLKGIGLWDINPLNLFRITWHNEPVPSGGQFGNVNYLEFPRELTGVDARIIALVGKWFPTGSHKVGATYGCLVPRLVTGQFDPTTQKAAWPSTGNFCRGGAYNATLLGCESIAILPEGMSRERFQWLATVAGEVIATPGCESNVKEIFDKCWELRRTRGNVVIFNQFDEYGNHLWHYQVTGRALEEVLAAEMGEKGRCAGFVSQTGSAGTIGAGDYLKERFPGSKIVASEARQCPTLLRNGYGDHRIEGIGDKHIPWIHNVRNTDVVTAIDDEACVSLVRLFNEPEGKRFLSARGVAEGFLPKLALLGISGIGNLLSAIKFAKYYELTGRDIILTVLTDSMELYGTRVEEMRQARGPYTQMDAAADYHRYLMGEGTTNMLELGFPDRKRIHNLKYFTWIEQQMKSIDELNAQWADFPDFWGRIHQQVEEIDRLIEAFNERTGVLRDL